VFVVNTTLVFNFYSYMTPGVAGIPATFTYYPVEAVPFGAWTQLSWNISVPAVNTGSLLWLSPSSSSTEEFYVYVDDFSLTSEATNCG